MEKKMGMFEKRHYQAIAEVVASFGVDQKLEPPTEIELVARALAAMFSKDNPNFKREKFLKACGMEEG